MKEGYVVIRLLPDQPFRTLEDMVGLPLVAHIRDYDFIDVEAVVDGKAVTKTMYTKEGWRYFEILSNNPGEFMEQYLRDAIQFAEQLAPVYCGDTQIIGANLVLEKREDGSGHNPSYFELTED